MLELWVNLLPLIFASAVLPFQTILTLRLVRSSVAAAFAWVAGMMTVRLIQGLLFGVVLTASKQRSGPNSPRYVLGTLLLVLAILLYTKGVRAALGGEDKDAPPPTWLTKAGSMSPAAAFGAGAGFLAISVKLLVFTMGAISAITEANLANMVSALMFVLFVALAGIAPLTILALGTSSSNQSKAILESFGSWLRRKNRAITILFGLVFGTWFLVKAFRQLAVF